MVLKYKKGDLLASLTEKGLTVIVQDGYETIPGYWCRYEYTEKEYDPYDELGKAGNRMYRANELEDEKQWILISPKQHTYKYHVGQYFMTDNQNIPTRIVALFNGEYLVQMFYPNSKPLFFTTQEVIDEHCKEVVLLPAPKRAEDDVI